MIEREKRKSEKGTNKRETVVVVTEQCTAALTLPLSHSLFLFLMRWQLLMHTVHRAAPMAQGVLQLLQLLRRNGSPTNQHTLSPFLLLLIKKEEW